MKYGVVVCSNCKMAKGILLSNKTTRCNRCGKILNLKKTLIFYKTESEEKLRWAIGEVNRRYNK
jgi:hypothetical protein